MHLEKEAARLSSAILARSSLHWPWASEQAWRLQIEALSPSVSCQLLINPVIVMSVAPAALPTAASPTTASEPDTSAANQGRKYKSRKERPCDACRRRKVCCIREPGDDACSLCRMQQTICQYDQGPTPRRRRPPGLQPKLSRNNSASTPPPSNAGPITPGLNIAPRPPHLQRPSQQHLSQQLHSQHVPVPPTAAPQPPPQPLQDHANREAAHPIAGEWISQFVGLSGDQDPFVLRHCNFNRSNYYKSGDWACLRVRTDDEPPSHFTVIPSSQLDARPSHYPSSDMLNAAYPLHHDLLATYFEIVHTSFPILDPSRYVKGNKIDTPLLATMYGLARPFCPSAQGKSPDMPHDGIHQFVFQALPIEARSPRLETIEAALLFIHRHTTNNRTQTMPGLYADVGLLAGMCFDVGLNVDPTKWNLSQADRSRRKRLWWALYIHDKWAALGLGRPSYLHEDDCSVPLLTVEDIAPTTVSGDRLPQTSAKMFVAMAALSQILSMLLSNFYTLKAIARLPTVPVAEVAEMGRFFERKLTSFYTEHLLPLNQVNDMLLDPTGEFRVETRSVWASVAVPISEPICPAASTSPS